MHIVVLAGGIGGARFLQGVRAVAESQDTVTAIGNVADDVTLHGLRICPDLDSVMYTLGGGADTVRGWGRRDETWTVKEELAAYGAEPTWFGLGDRDIATHLVRTRMLGAGYPLSAVTEALCARWQIGIRLLPATDDRVETHVVVDNRAIHFQEWWVRYRATPDAQRFVFVGAEDAKPAAGVLDALHNADVVLIAPSNPVVSIAPILAVGGIRDAIVHGSAPVIGVSPIIGGAPVRGMADKCLAAVGAECSAAGVARLLGARRNGGILDGWLIDENDRGPDENDQGPDEHDQGPDENDEGPDGNADQSQGIRTIKRPLWMTDEQATAAIVRAALELAGV